MVTKKKGTPPIVYVGFLLLVGGGYFGYTKFLKPPSGVSQGPAPAVNSHLQRVAPVASDPTVSGTVKLAGSTSAASILPALKAAFEMANPNVKVTLVPGIQGSGAGITALSSGRLDLAVSSAPLTEAQKASGLQEYLLTSAPIAFFAKSDIALTSEDVKSLLSEGAAKGHRLLLRTGSGTTTSLAEAVGVDPATVKGIKIPDNKTLAIAKVKTTPGLIGYAVYPHVAQQTSVKVLRVDGVAPSDEGYSIQLAISLVSKGELTPAEKAFVSWVQNDPAAQVAISTGWALAK